MRALAAAAELEDLRHTAGGHAHRPRQAQQYEADAEHDAHGVVVHGEGRVAVLLRPAGHGRVAEERGVAPHHGARQKAARVAGELQHRGKQRQYQRERDRRLVLLAARRPEVHEEEGRAHDGADHEQEARDYERQQPPAAHEVVIGRVRPAHHRLVPHVRPVNEDDLLQQHEHEGSHAQRPHEAAVVEDGVRREPEAGDERGEHADARGGPLQGEVGGVVAAVTAGLERRLVRVGGEQRRALLVAVVEDGADARVGR
mmetsp:Transcript_3511/g.10099  ORF Transcript_3511/g.10099 Transcript_3511/m.10099 type:complete len:257 (+) Transcript_3511:480-1250(+)